VPYTQTIPETAAPPGSAEASRKRGLATRIASLASPVEAQASDPFTGMLECSFPAFRPGDNRLFDAMAGVNHEEQIMKTARPAPFLPRPRRGSARADLRNLHSASLAGLAHGSFHPRGKLVPLGPGKLGVNLAADNFNGRPSNECR
jgi:hypothetical protein